VVIVVELCETINQLTTLRTNTFYTLRVINDWNFKNIRSRAHSPDSDVFVSSACRLNVAANSASVCGWATHCYCSTCCEQTVQQLRVIIDGTIGWAGTKTTRRRPPHLPANHVDAMTATITKRRAVCVPDERRRPYNAVCRTRGNYPDFWTTGKTAKNKNSKSMTRSASSACTVRDINQFDRVGTS